MRENEQRITQWRQVLSSEGCGPEVIDELESHLRDEIHRLVLAGEAEQRAMDIACARLGSPTVLAAEFAKVASPATWLPIQLVYGVLIVLAFATCALALFSKGGQVDHPLSLLLRLHVASITFGYIAALLAGFLAVSYVVNRLFHGLTPGQSRSLSVATLRLSCGAAALTALGIILGAVWAKGQLGRYWGWDSREIGGSMVLIWTLVLALLAWRRPAAVHAMMQVAVLGNVIVAAAWFGPVCLDHALRSFGRSGLFYLLAFIGMQVVVIAVSLAPARILRRQRV